jgi:hypothetical protein
MRCAQSKVKGAGRRITRRSALSTKIAPIRASPLSSAAVNLPPKLQEIAMRRAVLPGILGLTFCLALASVALIAHRQAAGDSGLLAALALATAAAIELARPLALFGLHGRLGAWLLTALAGLLVFLEIARAWSSRAAKPAPKPAPPRPYALPARVAVALQAAARARR